MNETIALAVQLHLFFIFLSLLAYVVSMFYVKKEVVMKTRAFSTHTLILLVSVMFTGLIVMAMAQFQVSLLIWAMIPLWLYLLYTAIQRARHLKFVPDIAMDFTFLYTSYRRDLVIYAVSTIILFWVY